MGNLLRKLHLLPQKHRAQGGVAKADRDLVVPNARRSYADVMANLLATHDENEAMSIVVGGQFDLMGEALAVRLERFGLQLNDYLIDVGCGSGRVAWALSQSKYRDTLRYLGLDIVPEMLKFAIAKCQQPSWRFEIISELKIPEADNCADMVCFFSVFTHLMQEESFLYLREAQRVLRPGGKIVATYLDINDPEHWKIFEANVKTARARQEKPMDILLCADFIKVWANKLDLEILEEKAPDCGQRTCILQKR